ncbi:MAG TPA: ATP-binding protein [Pseudonocardiaceae bacterium]|nr:ATP-binding protein [Pseudonocardiaceae bacterium]
MSSAGAGLGQIALLLVALAVAYRPLGDHMARVFTTTRHWRVEKFIYRMVRVDPNSDQRWTTYGYGVLGFSFVSVALLYLLQRIQPILPLVDNLLDSSRLATGAVEPNIRPVGYDEVVAIAMSGIDDRRLVEVDVDEHLPAVLADAGLLERVVANVVDNALRHGSGGRPLNGELPVAVRASAYGGQVELRVVDHGRGLPKGSDRAVFAPFQRLGDRDATTGVGLGLSVAKGFTEAMGGTIRVEDTPGGGLTVVISLREEKA